MTKKYGEIQYRQHCTDEAAELLFELMKEHAGKYSTAEWFVAFTSVLIMRRDIANFLIEEKPHSLSEKAKTEVEE